MKYFIPKSLGKVINTVTFLINYLIKKIVNYANISNSISWLKYRNMNTCR